MAIQNYVSDVYSDHVGRRSYPSVDLSGNGSGPFVPIQSAMRLPQSYSSVTGSPFTLSSAWHKVATVSSATTALLVSPITTASTYDIEICSVAAGAAAPTDAYGVPVGGGWDGGGGDPLFSGDIYLKSATGQIALVKTGA